MINIISKSYCSRVTSGPKKVVDNLIKGLELIGYPYVVNKRLDACGRLWVHDDTAALERLHGLDPAVKVVVGPNLFVLPRQIPAPVDLSRAIYIQPSDWAKDFWRDFGFSACPLEAWPTGIDANEFRPSQGKKEKVLVYFKERSPEDLVIVGSTLKRKAIAYEVLSYPGYREKNYKELLAKSRYVVWLGRQESQGLALLEALATNTPILVCDVSYFGQWHASAKKMSVFDQKENLYPNTTSAPYFNDSCGIKIKDLKQLDKALDDIENSLPSFHPRQYIEQHLSLEKQAHDFLNIYQKYFGLSEESGKAEKQLKEGDWQNKSFPFRVKFLLKDVYKSIR